MWALGDCAEVPQPEGDGTYAPTAQNATREGEFMLCAECGGMALYRRQQARGDVRRGCTIEKTCDASGVILRIGGGAE
mgnify:CR=1 FL=1